MNSYFKYFGIIALTVVVCLAGCKTKAGETPDVVVSLMGYDGCKLMPEAGMDGLRQIPMQECLEYDYDGRGTLVLKHVNSGFNCCPGELTADVTVIGKRIRIFEKEKEAGCHCLCLYDLDYRIENVAGGVYLVAFVCPYVEAHEEMLEVELDLSGPGNGRICVDREHYPW
jgi:hypothetical protein